MEVDTSNEDHRQGYYDSDEIAVTQIVTATTEVAHDSNSNDVTTRLDTMMEVHPSATKVMSGST